MAAHRPHRGRAVAGAALYAILMAAGMAILLILFVLQPLSGKDFDARLEAMELGAVFAFPPLLVYLWVPWIIDRFDPEPWWCLGLALMWGAVAAAGFSGLINTQAAELAQQMAGGGKEGAEVGDIVASCISAPLVEEFWKGLAVFGIFFFLRREFDGTVDGIIYGTFAALGFAATENVTYYARAALVENLGHQQGALTTAFILRGVLSPWGHPLYTSMTGIGFGIARETSKTWLKWLAPVFGYGLAVLLHGVWNGAATISGMLVMLMLPLWLAFTVAFFGIICWLVARKGRIIRENLRDEVLTGALSQDELDLICSPIGRLRATFSYGGSVGRRFVAHGARLGLCKWHAARALRGKKETISMGFIAPLRQELARLRFVMLQRLGRLPAHPPAWHRAPGQWHGHPGWPPPRGGPVGGGRRREIAARVGSRRVPLDHAEILGKVRLFSGLAPDALAAIASITTEESHDTGKQLFAHGDMGDRFFLILDGKIRISRDVPGMGEEALAVLGAGDVFGEMCLFGEAPRSADARVHENCRLLSVSKDRFADLLFLRMDLARDVLWNAVRILSRRLRETDDKLTFLSISSKF